MILTDSGSVHEIEIESNWLDCAKSKHSIKYARLKIPQIRFVYYRFSLETYGSCLSYCNEKTTFRPMYPDINIPVNVRGGVTIVKSGQNTTQYWYDSTIYGLKGSYNGKHEKL